MRQFAFDIFTGADKIHRIIIMLFNAGGYGKDIGVKDDVFRRKTDLFSQNFISTTANLDFARAGIRLTNLIKGHYDHRSAVATHQPRVMYKGVNALFHRDGVDDALALNALQPFFNHLPL